MTASPDMSSRISSSPGLLNQMQSLIAELNDLPVTHDVNQFLIGSGNSAASDEQVLVAETDDGAELGVYIDSNVLLRLQHCDPMLKLCDANLADFCTALEGVSHFQYLVWCMQHGRAVSLIELELQAEVDKYSIALWLLLQQTQGRFPGGLHMRMFSQVSFAKELDKTGLQRYQEANRCAAYYCQYTDRKFLSCRQRRVDCWLRELRNFYRCSHHAKLRRALH